MAYNFPYLKDSTFLKKVDEIKIKEQFIKLIVLNFNDEKPIQEIQGQITGGNINLDGSSGMRRTGSISMVIDDYENDLTDTKHLLSINKKIEILIGFTNTTDEYLQFPILWFPQGVFVIIAPNITHDSTGINISLTIHDKMALLNGECGGTLPASIIFHEVEDIDENGDVQIKQVPIYQIIQELVNHFGGQPLNKIIISDIDNTMKKTMRWMGSTPLYYVHDDNAKYFLYDTNYNALVNTPGIDSNLIKSYSYGEDVGYILTDFTYPGELISNAGDTVVTILDQIKNILGNYEYFYDIDGNFRFQEIKNYLNTSYSKELLNTQNYAVDYAGGKSIYTFENANIIQSYTNTPQYQQIKNDFLIWGTRTSIEGQEIPIRYHLAIDKKPKVGNEYKVFFYTDPQDGIVKAKRPAGPFEELPQNGDSNIYYYQENNNEYTIYKWDANIKEYIPTAYKLKTITSTDWRTELYLNGVINQPFGLDSNYYYTELKNEWPKIYDVKEQKFFQEILNHPENMDFFLDFIDTSSAIAEFSVQNIGRRTLTIVDDTINCIFEPEIPNIVIIEKGTNETNNKTNECMAKYQDFTQVNSQIYSMLLSGGFLKSAYSEIQKELYQYTNYNEQVSLTTLPIYYLEPNTRITIRDPASGIYGDYIIKSISLPLDINGTMSISCTKALERL